jgi:hypothetical protein
MQQQRAIDGDSVGNHGLGQISNLNRRSKELCFHLDAGVQLFTINTLSSSATLHVTGKSMES